MHKSSSLPQALSSRFNNLFIRVLRSKTLDFVLRKLTNLEVTIRTITSELRLTQPHFVPDWFLSEVRSPVSAIMLAIYSQLHHRIVEKASGVEVHTGIWDSIRYECAAYHRTKDLTSELNKVVFMCDICGLIFPDAHSIPTNNCPRCKASLLPDREMEITNARTTYSSTYFGIIYRKWFEHIHKKKAESIQKFCELLKQRPRRDLFSAKRPAFVPPPSKVLLWITTIALSAIVAGLSYDAFKNLLKYIFHRHRDDHLDQMKLRIKQLTDQQLMEIFQYLKDYVHLIATEQRLRKDQSEMGIAKLLDRLQHLEPDPLGVALLAIPTESKFYVLESTPGSAAANAGILPGDIIKEINGKKVSDFQKYRNIAKANLQKKHPLFLTITRRGKDKTIQVDF